MRLPRGSAQWLSGWAPFLLFFAALSLCLALISANPQARTNMVLIASLFVGSAVLSVVRSGVYVYDDHLLIVKPIGSKRWDRQDVVAVHDGWVSWGTSRVFGIELELTNGKKRDLWFSYYLGGPRRREWLEILNAWLEGKPIPLEHDGPEG